MDIEQAKSEVNELFTSLAPVVEEIAAKYSTNLDNYINKLMDAPSLTNDEIRTAMLNISLESYMFGILKDGSLLRQECAVALLKEAQAKAYNNTDGTQMVRSNQSIIDTSDTQVVSMLYSSVANLMKTKLDEAHRVVNTLNSILISRNAEAKLANGGYENSERQILNE